MDAETTPLSFEGALVMGQTGRVLPTTSISGRRFEKTSTIVSGRNIDLDEEDWC